VKTNAPQSQRKERGKSVEAERSERPDAHLSPPSMGGKGGELEGKDHASSNKSQSVIKKKSKKRGKGKGRTPAPSSPFYAYQWKQVKTKRPHPREKPNQLKKRSLSTTDMGMRQSLFLPDLSSEEPVGVGLPAALVVPLNQPSWYTKRGSLRAREGGRPGRRECSHGGKILTARGTACIGREGKLQNKEGGWSKDCAAWGKGELCGWRRKSHHRTRGDGLSKTFRARNRELTKCT